MALRCADLVVLETTLESYLLLAETLVWENPDNPHMAVLLSNLYAYYGFAFVVDGDVERARRHYRRGIELGTQALARNPLVRRALEDGTPLYKCTPHLRAGKDVPAAFCTAMNQGMLLICSLDVPEALGEANAFTALVEWVIEQDEGYFGGTAHSLLGVSRHNARSRGRRSGKGRGGDCKGYRAQSGLPLALLPLRSLRTDAHR